MQCYETNNIFNKNYTLLIYKLIFDNIMLITLSFPRSSNRQTAYNIVKSLNNQNMHTLYSIYTQK